MKKARMAALGAAVAGAKVYVKYEQPLILGGTVPDFKLYPPLLALKHFR